MCPRASHRATLFCAHAQTRNGALGLALRPEKCAHFMLEIFYFIFYQKVIFKKFHIIKGKFIKVKHILNKHLVISSGVLLEIELIFSTFLPEDAFLFH